MTTTKGRQTAATSEGPHGSVAAEFEAVARGGNGRADQVSEPTEAKTSWPSTAATFAGLAEAAARWMPEPVAKAWTEPFTQMSEAPGPASGFAKRAYEFWRKELEPQGYKLRAQIMDFPGGMPGDVGMFLRW